MRYEFRPLGAWRYRVTDDRPRCRFRASWADTLRRLASETEALGAPLVVLQVDAQPGQIRNDGMLYTRARVGFPGVLVSFGSRHGSLSYASDRYDDWQDNVRAIALSLEALRAVDRYGVVRSGEQYRGWAAIEPPRASAEQAAKDLLAGYGGLTAALKATHPDHGGSADDFRKVMEARRVLGL